MLGVPFARPDGPGRGSPLSRAHRPNPVIVIGHIRDLALSPLPVAFYSSNVVGRIRVALRGIILGIAWGVVAGGVHGTSPAQGARVGLLLWAPLVVLSLRGPYAHHLETATD
jgi:hypothetical protein